MKKRKRLKKKNSNILRLKIHLEEKDVAEEELSIGSLELAEVLQGFSKKVKHEQREMFNQSFFGAPNIINQSADSKELTVSYPEKELDLKKSTVSMDPWVKKLYKKVVQRSHPDRYIDFPFPEIKNKYTRIYMDAVTAIEKNDIGLLLLCAYEVEIEVDEPQAQVYISDSISDYTKRIQAIKNTPGYQWYHALEKNKLYFLENYLKNLGYVFDVVEAEKVIKKRKVARRKPGSRPEKILRVKK